MLIRIFLVLLPSIIFANFTQAQQISAEKRVLVDQLLVINQTSNLIPLMSSALTGQIISAMTKSRGSIDDDLKAIIHIEVKKAIDEQFVHNNKLNDIFYTLYDEYFTVEQLQNIVNFYNSPAGKQLLKHAQDITINSQKQAKNHAKVIGPIVQQRLLKIFEDLEKKANAHTK